MWVGGLPLLGLRAIRFDGRADERLESRLVDLVTLFEIDRAARVAFEAGVEELRWIFQRRAFRKGQLHHRPVALASAEDAAGGPPGTAAPLPLLDAAGDRRLDEAPYRAERLFAPAAKLFDPRVDQRRGRAGLFLRRAL